jgi:hypothetical protein
MASSTVVFPLPFGPTSTLSRRGVSVPGSQKLKRFFAVPRKFSMVTSWIRIAAAA